MPKNTIQTSDDQHKAWNDLLRTLAAINCPQCNGSGQIKTGACDCACRSIFVEGHTRYQSYRSRQASLKTKVIEEIKGVLCSRPQEDYLADFEIVCRRAIAGALTPKHRLLFDIFYMDGEPVQGGLPDEFYKKILQDFDRRVAKRLGVSPVEVFKMKEVLTAALGHALLETQPYALYPFKFYFGPIQRKKGDYKRV